MSDIAERLRGNLDDGIKRHPSAIKLEAADEIERLRAALQEETECARQTDDVLAKAEADNERLRAALQRIDGINDNPACFNMDIEMVLRRALEPKP